MNVRFKISEERFFNNGRIIMNSMPDIETRIRRAFSREENVIVTSRKKKGVVGAKGIKANELNKALRRVLVSENFHAETHVENGAFVFGTKKGFDFSIFDEKYNLANIYNFYRGAKGILNGDEKIKRYYSKMRCTSKEWNKTINEMASIAPLNNDYICCKEKLTVMGELQFGNWALVYRDLFRLLNADADPGVDFYIYVAADDNLSDLLSDNTVSYKSAESVFVENKNIIKTPTWLIGLGIDEI